MSAIINYQVAIVNYISGIARGRFSGAREKYSADQLSTHPTLNPRLIRDQLLDRRAESTTGIAGFGMLAR